MKKWIFLVLTILLSAGLMTACSSEPELSEIQPVLKSESIRLLSQVDPTNGTSLAGMIETYNFKKKHSYSTGSDYVIQVSYRVRLLKSGEEMSPSQQKAAKLAFGSTRVGAVREIRSQEFRLIHTDGQWRIYQRAQ